MHAGSGSSERLLWNLPAANPGDRSFQYGECSR
jgi:hypothetical protein